MITEKRLAELEKIYQGKPGLGPFDEGLELVRLARLGLWAEQYGIEALEMGAFHHSHCPIYRSEPCLCAHSKVDLAIAALPEDAHETQAP